MTYKIGDVVNRECDRPVSEGACDSTEAMVYEVLGAEPDDVIYQCNLCEILSQDSPLKLVSDCPRKGLTLGCSRRMLYYMKAMT